MRIRLTALLPRVSFSSRIELAAQPKFPGEKIMSAGSSTATARIDGEPFVNVSFPIQGKQLLADHGYVLYSAISRLTTRVSTASDSDRANAVSADVQSAMSDKFQFVATSRSPLHKADWLAIELISGFPSGPGLITLSSSPDSKPGTRSSKLNLRIPAEHYRDVLPLAGKRLNIGGHQIRLGLPVARPLEPAPSLYARAVTIKKFTEPEPFFEAVKRKLDQFGIKGRVELPRDEQDRCGTHGDEEPENGFIGDSDNVAVLGALLQRLSAITECRDFSRLAFHNHIPIAQRLKRRFSRYLDNAPLVKMNSACGNVIVTVLLTPTHSSDSLTGQTKADKAGARLPRLPKPRLPWPIDFR
jgi:CRISPR-associated protein Cas6